MQNYQDLTDTCGKSSVIVPTLPVSIPREFTLDTTTNLHRTGTPQEIDLKTYRLIVTGKVKHSLSLSFEQLRCMPAIKAEPELVCPLIFTDIAEWSGVRLAYILKLAQIDEDAVTVRLTSADGYYADLPVEDALSPEAFLAYEWEGEPLPILHGFPLRAILPGQEGSLWVKWLFEIDVQ